MRPPTSELASSFQIAGADMSGNNQGCARRGQGRQGRRARPFAERHEQPVFRTVIWPAETYWINRWTMTN